MIKNKIFLLVISSMLFGEYLQEGIYPDCSYVIVTEDGWRIHKNYEGRVLSMKSPTIHNDKTGKYSFDDYGNLIEFSQCTTEDILRKKIEKDVNINTNTDEKIEISLDFDFGNVISKIKKLYVKPTLSVHGGVITPFGGNLGHYPIGYKYGLDINFNKLSVSLLGFNVANKDNSNTSQSLTANGFLINYTLNWKNIYIKPGFGAINTEGEFMSGVSNANMDNIFRTDVGLYLNKAKNMSIYIGGIRSFTYLGNDQGASYYNIGLNYRF